MINNKKKIPRSTYTRTLIKPDQVAEMLGISVRSVYKGACGTNTLTRLRFGRSVRFIQQEVEKMIENATKQGR